LLLHGDDEPRRVVCRHRKVLRLHMQGDAQMAAEPRQLHQPVGLALRRPLGQGQAARQREDPAQVGGQHLDTGTGSGRHGLQALVAQVGPGRLRGEVVLDDQAHGGLQG